MSSIKTLVIGDPHFKVSNTYETDLMVSSIFNIIQTNNYDIVVVLGDILDRHETIHVSPLTRAMDFLCKLIKIIPTFILIGNHDLKNNKQFMSEEHPFTSLKYFCQAYEYNNDLGIKSMIIDKTAAISIKNQKFIFVPYVPPGRFIEALELSPTIWNDATCIFAHQEFYNCQMGAIKSTQGDKWDLNNPFVISGHIHDYDELQSNILYVGTPIQHTYSDKNDKTISSFVFMDNYTREEKRHSLNLPKKHIIHINYNDISEYKPLKNCKLKIIISGTSAEIKAIMRHPNIEVLKKLGHKIAYKDLPSDSKNKTNTLLFTNNIRFSNCLLEKINDNERLKTLYNKIFSV